MAGRLQHAHRHGVAHGQGGGRPQAVFPGAQQRRLASVEGRRPGDDPLGPERDAGRLEDGAVPGQAPARDAHGTVPARHRRFDRHHQHVPMAEVDQVLRGAAGATVVVDLHGAVLRPGRGVDEHHGETGPADHLDLRVALVQPDHDHAVHGGTPDRAGERPVQRRDEEEPEAAFLGHRRDTLGEEGEEGVGEDLGQRLRRQDPDRRRLPRRQHARHGVRTVLERRGDLVDPGDRLRAQPLGAVEGERDGGLAYARLPGDVGDAGATDP